MADHGDSPTPDYNGSSVTVIRRIDQAQPAVVYGLLAILLAAVFVPMSLYRLVDGDEGTYLLVSRLVVEGQLPYHHFFYPQMFLLPYVYGGWMRLVGYSWYGARLLSAVFSIALGLLVYRQAARLAGARAWGVLAVGVFTRSGLLDCRDRATGVWRPGRMALASPFAGSWFAITRAALVATCQFPVIFVLNLVSWVADALAREFRPLASPMAVPLLLVSPMPT